MLTDNLRTWVSLTLLASVMQALSFAYADTRDQADELAWLAAQRVVNSAATQVITERSLIDSEAPEYAALLRERREIVTTLSKVRSAIAQPLLEEADGAFVADALVRRERDLVLKLLNINRAIQERQPDVSRYLRPRPLSLSAAQRLLGANEALFLMVPTEEEIFIFCIKKDDFHWHRSSPDDKRVQVLVSSIRDSIGAGAQTRGIAIAPSAERLALSSFDGESAFELYDLLLAPFADMLAGVDTIYAVKSGALRAIPLSILMTSPPKYSDGYLNLNRADFLIDKVAIGELPSVTSLQTLRCRALAAEDGCVPKETASHKSSSSTLTFVGIGAPDLLGEGLITRAATKPAESNLADPGLLRQMSRLPGALSELMRIESALPSHAEPHILVADQATEAALKSQLAPQLADANIVVFATHGLVGDEQAVLGVSEPGLVLTPPEGSPTDFDDGYLAASEVAGMEIPAQLIVLSACNTIGGVTAAQEDGVGGLSRAFFAAGADAILASHWSVSDQATADLISSTVAMHIDGESGPQALRRAILSMRQTDLEADPFMWGGFSYVGVAGP